MSSLITIEHCDCDHLDISIGRRIDIDDELEAERLFRSLSIGSMSFKDDDRSFGSRWSLLDRRSHPDGMYFSIHFQGRHVIGLKRGI